MNLLAWAGGKVFLFNFNCVSFVESFFKALSLFWTSWKRGPVEGVKLWRLHRPRSGFPRLGPGALRLLPSSAAPRWLLLSLLNRTLDKSLGKKICVVGFCCVLFFFFPFVTKLRKGKKFKKKINLFRSKSHWNLAVVSVAFILVHVSLGIENCESLWIGFYGSWHVQISKSREELTKR